MLKAYLENTRKILRLYALGALCFFIGVGLIQWADKLLPPSLQQETMALLGLLCGGAGFIIAMTAQCLLIAQRFNNLGRKK
ncbi:MAG: hypothetical protein GY813_02185 [Halieaceae bacterium]|nr:hypothetical protein [Halieaceae bacterium]